MGKCMALLPKVGRSCDHTVLPGKNITFSIIFYTSSLLIKRFNVYLCRLELVIYTPTLGEFILLCYDCRKNT